MAAEIISKRCSKCKQTKPISEFHKNPASHGGHINACKNCQHQQQKYYRQSTKGKSVRECYIKSEKGKTAYKRYEQSTKCKTQRKLYHRSKEGKATDKRFYIHHPNNIKATKAVNHSIEAGKLISPSFLFCHYCHKPAQQYHHWHGYAPEHWLDVIPVCIKCHNKIPKKISHGVL